jgi:hypothetical protein
MVFIFIPLASTNTKACHALQCHVLALEPNMDVFTKVLEPLVVVHIPKATCPVVSIDDEDSLMERRPRRILDCE